MPRGDVHTAVRAVRRGVPGGLGVPSQARRQIAVEKQAAAVSASQRSRPAQWVLQGEQESAGQPLLALVLVAVTVQVSCWRTWGLDSALSRP